MGVLEDAIREHLELKRQHGASEEEVVRQETEVLGHARREAAPAEGDQEAVPADDAGPGEGEAAVADEAPPEEPLADADATEPAPFEEGPAAVAAGDRYADEPVAPGLVSEAADPAEEPFDHELDPEPPAGFAADDHSREDTVLLDEPVEFDEIEPGASPPMPAREEEPRSSDLPPVTEDGDPVDDEDVLEETPEFLQETPEHDRLWFEQKPPRDFDFD